MGPARLRAFALALAALSGGTSAAAEETDLAPYVEEWREADDRPLDEFLVAARRLASTQCDEALELLLAAYGAGGAGKEKRRELLASLVAERFDDPEFAVRLLTVLCRRYRDPEHAWLAHELCVAWIQAGREHLALEAIEFLSDRPYNRAAALRAFATQPGLEGSKAARRILSNLPEEPLERSLLVAAAARVLEADAKSIPDPANDIAVATLLDELDRAATPPRTRVVLARAIAGLVGSEEVFADKAAWRAFLDDKSVRDRLARDGYASDGHAYFFGMRITGRDIVYVIDASGSMDARISRRPQLAAPVTGGGRAGRARQDALRGIESLPWDRIRTRFDAVREALKASLRSLGPKQTFAVVLFADGARRMPGTPSLVPATRENVERTCSALDAMNPGGGTNAHRGLELGFGVSQDRSTDRPEAASADRVLRGPDTVIFLTDGEPTHDDYSPQRGPRGPVYGRFLGSYANLLLAIRHWNLFTDCEVDCVGMQGADASLLRAVAETGRGRALILGE